MRVTIVILLLPYTNNTAVCWSWYTRGHYAAAQKWIKRDAEYSGLCRRCVGHRRPSSYHAVRTPPDVGARRLLLPPAPPPPQLQPRCSRRRQPPPDKPVPARSNGLAVSSVSVFSTASSAAAQRFVDITATGNNCTPTDRIRAFCTRVLLFWDLNIILYVVLYSTVVVVIVRITTREPHGQTPLLIQRRRSHIRSGEAIVSLLKRPGWWDKDFRFCV